MTDESTYTADDPMIDETFNKQRSTENAAAPPLLAGCARTNDDQHL
jgi:hypothetical protein